MYTFNLSRGSKPGSVAAPAKAKPSKKEAVPGIPFGEDIIDIRPIDMAAKKEESKEKMENPEDQTDDRSVEKIASHASNANSMCATF